MGSLLGRGELLLLTVGLSATALGDLVSTGRLWEKAKLLAAGVSAANIALCSFYFALLSGRYNAGEEVVPGAVVALSLTFYVSALVCSGFCVVLTALSDREEAREEDAGGAEGE